MIEPEGVITGIPPDNARIVKRAGSFHVSQREWMAGHANLLDQGHRVWRKTAQPASPLARALLDGSEDTGAMVVFDEKLSSALVDAKLPWWFVCCSDLDIAALDSS